MKATDLQREIIDLCIMELEFWKNSNDINSPTHYCDIAQEINELVFDLKIVGQQAESLIWTLHELLNKIKSIK